MSAVTQDTLEVLWRELYTVAGKINKVARANRTGPEPAQPDRTALLNLQKIIGMALCEDGVTSIREVLLPGSLLVRYMTLIVDEEGTSYLERAEPGRGVTEVAFSADEMAVLEVVERAVMKART